MRHVLALLVAELSLTVAGLVATALLVPLNHEVHIAEIVSEVFVSVATLVAVTSVASLSQRSRCEVPLVIGGTLFYLATVQSLLGAMFDEPMFLAVVEDGLFTAGVIFLSIGLLMFVRNQRTLLEDVQDARNRLAELSITDGLTGLYNSRHFYDRLNQEIVRTNRYGRSLSVMLLDIDDFKRHNDDYGHISGDRVLKRLGDAVTSLLRENDTAYRYGGEEFTVLLPETDVHQGLIVAERLRARFAEERFDDGVSKTISIGVAEYHTGEEPSAFVRRADQAMYTAKRAGKNRVAASLDETVGS